MTDRQLEDALDDVAQAVAQGLAGYRPKPESEEVGLIHSVGQGIAWVEGLGGVQAEERVLFDDGIEGLALDILADRVGVVLFGASEALRAGREVRRSGRVLDFPVGSEFLGRVVNSLGRPLDGKGPPTPAARWPMMREAPRILDRAPVEKPLETGLKVVDALIPVGRGQRELILGDRQTGKTAIALDTIINQRDKNVLCVYCAIGQRSSSIAKAVDALRRQDAMAYSVFVVAEGDDPPGLQYIAPYAATTLAEFFMQEGRDVLIVYDDLTRHALAYRQISLLLRRPPGREAFPGDIFYIHSRLLERSTHLSAEGGGGSLTALPIIETEAQNISAYIPTNLISITDGQIYLSPDLFQKGLLPAVDVGKSVSRVGGKAQFSAYRKVAGDLRLSYSQFQELESFARFGTRLEEGTRKALEHGRRVREVLKQDQYAPLSAADQILVLFATARGLLDAVPLASIAAAEKALLNHIRETMAEFEARLLASEKDDAFWEELAAMMAEGLEPFAVTHADAGKTQ